MQSLPLRSRLFAWLGGGLSILLATLVAAQQELATTDVDAFDPALRERLEAIDARVERVKDLTAEFEESKHTALLKKPLVSTGVVRVRGSFIRWDTLKPHAMSLAIDAERIQMYYPQRKTVEVYLLDDQLRQLALSPLPRLAVLRRHFTVQPLPLAEIDPQADPASHLALKLTPRSPSLRRHLDRVHVLLDFHSVFAERVEMFDADGDRTLLRFSHVRIDTGLRDSDVTLTLPEGTTIVHPLGETYSESDRPERTDAER